MKFSIFSTFLPISCTFLLSLANSAVIENDAAAASVTVTQKTIISGNDRISAENGNVNSRNSEEIPNIPSHVSENSRNNNRNTSASVTTTIKTKGRRTKVLEKPIDSQLISQFRELSNTNVNNISGISRDSLEHVPKKLPPSPQQETSTIKLPPQQPHQPSFYETRRRLMKRKIFTSSPLSPPRRFFLNNTKREDAIIPEGPPGSELEFPFHVSPIEGSLGGFTGLQGLEPLTPVQFIKTLIAVTPFIIPLIFIPLLIFTIGILMIPVTKANVFLDVGELGRRKGSSFDLLPSFLANPIKTISSAVATGSQIPRSLAYEIGSKLLDTEECVERLSCEISERYLSYSNWEQGNWRSVVNRSWISRILSLFGRNHPAVSRIAKSLESDHDESLLMMSVMSKERDRYLREKLRRSTSHEICRRYTCQPRTLLKKFISSSMATPSPSSSLVSFAVTPVPGHEEEEAMKLLSKSENEQESVNL